MYPRGSVRAAQKPIRFVVTDDSTLCRVPRQAAAEFHRKIGQDARGGGDVALFDVRDRFGAAGDCGEEVLHVRTIRRRCVRLSIQFIPRVLIQLVGDIAVDRRTSL